MLHVYLVHFYVEIMKKQLSLLVSALLLSNASFAFTPHQEPLVKQNPPKPNILMVLDTVLVKPQWTHSLYNSHTQQDSCSRYMYEDALNCNTVYIQQYLFSSLLYSKCFV